MNPCLIAILCMCASMLLMVVALAHATFTNIALRKERDGLLEEIKRRNVCS